ncbi:MAG: ACT domain-containing protein [Pseudomonadota bacterium]|nr:ACT domain-containing protein [Pseudomonadota bacterium]
MPAERQLDRLLAGMKPVLDAPIFVFVCLGHREVVPDGVRPLMQFEESEGRTLILARDDAERAGLAFTYPCRRITLSVQSALDAVGFIASVAAALSEAGISCNPVAGYHHDHLFVPADRAADALRVLEELGRRGDFD